MIKIPYDEIASKIIEETGISESELNDKVEEKLSSLSGLVSKEGAAHIVANELGVKIVEQTSGKVQIAKIMPGMRSLDILAKVQRVFEEKAFNSGSRSGKLRSLVVGDETGTIRLVFWNDQTDKIQTVKEGDIIQIQDCYVKENNGQKEIHIGDKAKVELNPPGETVGEVKVTQQARTRKKVQELQENDNNVEVLGTIVQSFEPRYFEVCPFCNKRTRMTGGNELVCEAHGKVPQKYSYVMNAIVDDGSGTIRAVFFKNQAENLTGKSEEEFVSLKTSQEKTEQLKNDLLGEIVKMVGRVNKNSMFDRLEFVSQLVFRNPSPEEEIQK